MTYDPSVPNASQSPGLFPPQNSVNFTRLKAIFAGDHVFDDTAPTGGAQEGPHKQCTLINRLKPTVLPTGTNGILYTKTVSSVTQLYFWNGTTDFAITPPPVVNPAVVILACVNFVGTGPVNTNQTIRSSYGISSVVRRATGAYTINFSPALANANYIVQITGMRDSSGGTVNGQIAGNSAYANSVTTTALNIFFNGGSASGDNVLMGNVIIFGVA